MLDSALATFYPRGNYKIVGRGMPVEGSVADFSGIEIIDLDSGATIVGGAKIDYNSSDWREQGTLGEPEFEGIVLHIVANHDCQLFVNSREVMTLEICLTPEILDLYQRLPAICPSIFDSISEVEREGILSALLDQRIERKTTEVLSILRSVNGNWYECNYIHLLRCIGSPSRNKEAFEAIARRLNYASIGLHRNDYEHIISIALGLSGLLSVDNPDSYTKNLQDIFRDYQRANGTLPTASTWSNGKVRPSSMPAISLVSAMVILTEREELFDDIFRCQSVAELSELFKVQLPDYWQSHAAPSVAIGTGRKHLGEMKVTMLIINYVLPLLFARSSAEGKEEYALTAIRLYEELPAERYSVLNKWYGEKWQPHSSFDSQALLQLNDIYCKELRCARCRLGASVIIRRWHEMQRQKKSVECGVENCP